MLKNFDCPPYVYLVQVAEHCPKAMSTYLLLWREQTPSKRLTIIKNEISGRYLISVAKFNHEIRLLTKEGLIKVEETPKILHIELIGWNDD